jgi:hypothetical protein
MKPTLALAGCLFALSLVPVSAREYFVYFGTYTGAKSKGIYMARFDDKSGKLSAPELAAETKAPPSWPSIPRAACCTPWAKRQTLVPTGRVR